MKDILFLSAQTIDKRKQMIHYNQFITDKSHLLVVFMKQKVSVLSFSRKLIKEKPLLVLNGEIFDGAMQDRVANETVLIC